MSLDSSPAIPLRKGWPTISIGSASTPDPNWRRFAFVRIPAFESTGRPVDLKIIVCVKQVPFIGSIRFDIEAGRIVRDGATNVLNSFDRPAVAKAAELVREFGGSVT